METIGEGIGAGVVIGVSSGLILSLVLWLIDVGKHILERRDQLKYIADIITTNRDRILDAQDLHHPPTNRTIEKVDLRRLHYDAMRRELEAVFVGRASHISYDETSEIRKPFWTLDQNFNGKKAILDDKACMKLFDTLAGIGWLKITPKSPAS